MENINNDWATEHNIAIKKIDIHEKTFDDITINVLNSISKKTIPAHGTEYGVAYDVVASAVTSGQLYEYRIENKSRIIKPTSSFRAAIKHNKLKHLEKTQELAQYSNNNKVKYLFFYYEFTVDNRLLLYVFSLNNIKNMYKNNRKITYLNKYTQFQDNKDFKVEEDLYLFEMNSAIYITDLTNNQYVINRLKREKEETNNLNKTISNAIN